MKARWLVLTVVLAMLASALLSGGLYLPVEVYELLRHPTQVKAGILVGNLAVVVYLLYVRGSAARGKGVARRADCGNDVLSTLPPPR